jgi:hypothetical protein
MPTPAEEIREALHPDLQPLFYRHSCGLLFKRPVARSFIRPMTGRTRMIFPGSSGWTRG